MKPQLKNAARVGLTFGVVNIFIILIGLTITVSEIIGDMLNADSLTRSGNTTGLLIFFGLLGLWCGSLAARGSREKWQPAVINGLVAGFVVGLFTAAMAYLLGTLDAAEVDLRTYFAELSRPAIQLLLYGQTIVIGALINLAVFTISGVLGGIFSYASKTSDSSAKISHRISSWRESIKDSQVAQNYRSKKQFRLGVYGLFIVALFILPLIIGKYWNYALGTVGIYILMGLGLNIVVGLAGLLDLGYVAFFAIGAYTIGLLTAPGPIGIQMNFWLAMLISIFMAAFAGILLGLPVLRMRGDYLAIVTLGFGEIIRVLIKSDLLAAYLGGPQGIRDIAGPSLFGIPLNSERGFVYLIILAIILIIFFTIRLQSSRIGRAWVAMREDETVAQAMGISTYFYKLLAFATGAAFAGLGGVLFASRNQYTGPEDHSLLVSINVLCLVIVGGMGSIPGVIVGAFVLKGLPEILRDLELYRLLAFGALLVVMMIWRPEGLWPAPRRRMEIHDERDAEIVAITEEEAGA
jgi:ABC-type branched-subunit amino acid transport system permease subunit